MAPGYFPPASSTTSSLDVLFMQLYELHTISWMNQILSFLFLYSSLCLEDPSPSSTWLTLCLPRLSSHFVSSRMPYLTTYWCPSLPFTDSLRMLKNLQLQHSWLCIISVDLLVCYCQLLVNSLRVLTISFISMF